MTSTLAEIRERVEKDPEDFGCLEEFVNYADCQNDAEVVEDAYTRLLGKYPLCFAYWKRYADKVLSLGGGSESAKAAATAIYERSTEPLKYSVANWLNYLGFLAANIHSSSNSNNNNNNNTAPPAQHTKDNSGSKENNSNNNSDDGGDECVKLLRRAFEAAADAIGDSFDAYEFWGLVTDFEERRGENRRAAAAYERANGVAMKGSAMLWDRYLGFMQRVPFEEWLRADELGTWREQRATLCHTPEDERRLFTDTLTTAIEQRERVHNQAMTAVYRVAGFESAVAQRTFFHVTPLPDNVVAGWRAYLQWAEANEPSARVTRLYERCLVPACFYTEFWFMYIDYLKHRAGAIDAAREAFRRGAKLHYAGNLEFMIPYAVFEETYGGRDSAEAIYRSLLAATGARLPSQSSPKGSATATQTPTAVSEMPPRAVEVTMKYAAFLRRTGKVAECKALLAEASAPAPNNSSSSNNNSNSNSNNNNSGESLRHLFLLLHYARLLEHLGETAEARAAYIRATKEHAASALAWEHAIAFEARKHRFSGEEASSSSQAQTHISALLHRAVLDSCPLREEDKRRLWGCWHRAAAIWAPTFDEVRAVDADYALVCDGARPLWVHDNIGDEPPEKLAKLASAPPTSGVLATDLISV